MLNNLFKHFKSLFFQSHEFPITAAANKHGLDIYELDRFLETYGDFLEWGAGFEVINKLKSNKFHKVTTPAEALSDGSACWVDFMRKAREEVYHQKQLQNIELNNKKK